MLLLLSNEEVGYIRNMYLWVTFAVSKTYSKNYKFWRWVFNTNGQIFVQPSPGEL